MVTAFDVAGALIESQHAQNRTIDKLQLQKLLYLVQGTHMVLWGTPAFRENLTAYESGPVVVAVEKSYREAFPNTNLIAYPIPGSFKPLPTETHEVVDSVLAVFGNWSGTRLESHTKLPGSPWTVVWRGRESRWKPKQSTINGAAIRSWFGSHPIAPEVRVTGSIAEGLARLVSGNTDSRT